MWIKGEATPVAHGFVCWNELAVRDSARARKFYADTLDWRFEAIPTLGMTYWIILSGARRVGGMFEMSGPEFDGEPERWLTYIAVDDIDARLKKAVDAGAKICRDAFDIPGVGRMALLQEPGGALVAWMTTKLT